MWRGGVEGSFADRAAGRPYEHRRRFVNRRSLGLTFVFIGVHSVFFPTLVCGGDGAVYNLLNLSR